MKFCQQTNYVVKNVNILNICKIKYKCIADFNRWKAVKREATPCALEAQDVWGFPVRATN